MTQPKTPVKFQELQRHMLVRSLFVLDDWQAYVEQASDARITEIRFKISENRVLLIVKARTPKGSRVAFVDGDGLLDAAATLCYLLQTHALSWKPDKYAG